MGTGTISWFEDVRVKHVAGTGLGETYTAATHVALNRCRSPTCRDLAQDIYIT